MQVVILCGGKGTRLEPYSQEIPKPLMRIGAYPILWHIMKIYAHYGHQDFILCLGYLGDKIKEYFRDYTWKHRSCWLRMQSGKESEFQVLDAEDESWNILFAETGEDTNTGGRIKRIEPFIEGEHFFVTYGDGVARIDLSRLLEFHFSHGRIATVTAVRPRVSFGVMDVDDDGRVRDFREKPVLKQWVNGGFFVFRREVFRYLEEDSILEKEPLERLVADGELMAYRHTDFWMCMDTYKDNMKLNEIWNSGEAPWKVWD